MGGAPLPQERFDVAVLGAGAAGLAAAAELCAAGRSVALLEARERIGGRCWTLLEPGLAQPIELGAEFIHGEAEVTRALMRRTGVRAIDSVRVQRFLDRGRLHPVDGFAEAKKAVQGFSVLKDLSFDSLLKKRRLPEKTKMLARLMVEGFDAADPRLASARAIVEEWGGTEMGASQPRPLGGYGPLLGTLAAGLDPRKVLLRLQSPVSAVRWSKAGVRASGRFLGRAFTIHARRAIVTLPIGVLQAGSVRFSPALPKAHALQKLVSGPVVKVALRFRTPFWEEAHPTVGFFHAPGAAFPTFWTQLPVHAPFLIGWAGGPKALALSGLSEEAIVRHAMEALQRVFDRPVGGLLQAARVQDWRRDPWSLGAYSYVRVGGEGAREALAEPLADRLYFAGEATSVEQAGTVAGALESGARAARELLAKDSR